MPYSDKYNHEVKMDLVNEGQEFIVRMFMKNGELLFRERAAEFLQNEVAAYIAEAGVELNQEWIDGVCYALHIIKEADFDE